MTQDAFTEAVAAGKVSPVQPASPASDPSSPPATSSGETASAAPAVPSAGSGTDLSQFLPILMELQSVQDFLSAAPTFIPQTFQDQIQFVFDGSNYYLYLYFNNQWNAFPIASGGVVTSIAAGVGISVSASTGAIIITNVGVTSLTPGAGISISGGSTGALTISASGSGSGAKTNGAGQYIARTTTSPIIIPHGLGSTPSKVRLTIDGAFGGPTIFHMYGVYDASGQNCQGWEFTVGNSPSILVGGWIGVIFDLSSNEYRFTCTVDATNITLTVAAAGPSTPTGTYHYLWEAEA